VTNIVEQSTRVVKTFETNQEPGTRNHSQVWQWRVFVDGVCGSAVVQTEQIATTVGLWQYPCCPPSSKIGYAMSKAHRTAGYSNFDYTICPPEEIFRQPNVPTLNCCTNIEEPRVPAGCSGTCAPMPGCSDAEYNQPPFPPPVPPPPPRTGSTASTVLQAATTAASPPPPFGQGAGGSGGAGGAGGETAGGGLITTENGGAVTGSGQAANAYIDREKTEKEVKRRERRKRRRYIASNCRGNKYMNEFVPADCPKKGDPDFDEEKDEQDWADSNEGTLGRTVV